MPQSTKLYKAFFESSAGLCGVQDKTAVISQIEELEPRLHLITLGCILDPAPRPERWEELAHLGSHWLADSTQVAYKQSQEVEQAFREVRIRFPKHTPRVWWQICRGVQGRFKGSIRALLAANQDGALVVLKYLEESGTTFPVVSANVTSARWLDLVHRIGRVELSGWDQLRLPLSESLKEAAGLFGLDQENLHPALALALQVWEGACEGKDEKACGLEGCPRR